MTTSIFCIAKMSKTIPKRNYTFLDKGGKNKEMETNAQNKATHQRHPIELLVEMTMVKSRNYK